MLLCYPRKMSEHGTGIKECESLLLDKYQQLHPCNPEGIVADIFSCKARAEIGQLPTSFDKIAPLIVEAAQQFPQLPPLQPSNMHYGLLTFHHPHPNPIDSFQGIQTPLHWSHSWPQSHPSCVPHEFQAPFLFSHLQPQFHSSGTFYGLHAPLPVPHPQPQFGFSGKSHEFHVPLPHNVQTGPFHLGLPRLHPSISFHGIHAPLTPVGPAGAFQSPSPEFTGSGELMLEKEIRELLFLQQPPSLQVESLANMYMDRYGKPLRNEGLLIDGQQQGKVGCSLTDLLMRLNTTRVIERQGHQYIVPVEDAPMYLAHGFKLRMPPASSNSNKIFVVFMPESKFTEEDVHSYFSQYGTVNDVRIPTQGGRRLYGFVRFQDPGTAKQILSERIRHFICGDPVLVEEYKEKYELEQEHPPKYLAHGSKLGLPPARRDSNQIYVVFVRESKFTEDDVRNYFSQYGTVSNVRIPPQGKRMYGFVSFQDPGAAERILSERTPHFICGDQVCVKAYLDKDELERKQHHGFELVLPSARNGSNRIFITFNHESSFTKNDAWKYFSHYGPVNDVHKKGMFGYVSFKYPETVKRILSERCLRTSHFICGDHVFVEPYKEKDGPEMLARKVANFVLEPHEASDVDVIHEHHTGKQLWSNHDFYGEKLNEGRDQGIVTEKSSINVAPVMASPTRNLSVHSVSEASPSQGDNTVESSHVLNHLDDALADLDSHGLRLPETLEDVF